jgi:hypothetical protein
MYQYRNHDFDYGFGRERMVQMGKEVERDRLEARSAKGHLSESGAGFEEGGLRRRSVPARSAAFLTALFR